MGAARSGVGRRDGSLVVAPSAGEEVSAVAAPMSQESVSPSGRALLRDGTVPQASGNGAERAGLQAPPREDRASLSRALLRYALIEPHAPQVEAEPRFHGVASVLAAALAVVGAALLRGPLRAALPFALVAVAVLALLRRRRLREARAHERAQRRRERELLVRPTGLSLARRGVETPLIDLGGGFGATLLSSRSRDRVLLAVTTRTATLFLAAAFDAASRRANAGFLARASVVDGDESLDAVGPDGAPLDLSPADLVALCEGLTAIDPGAMERILLSDGRGRSLVLDGPSLRIGEHRFDLLLPIEWGAFLFQEPFGGAVTVFQATSVRQGAGAVVLVALVPSILGDPTPPPSTGIAELDRALLRDLRLTHAVAGEPPPSEQRVALDRLFVLPFRAALDRAPRSASQPSPHP
jgi:hypothetical protein